MSWKVTVRNGPDVDRATFETLEQALEDVRARAAQALAEGNLGTVKAFRDYTPDERVHARIGISGKGFMRGPEGGIDVMGDGALVAYTGAIRKRELGGDGLEEGLQRLQQALSS